MRKIVLIAVAAAVFVTTCFFALAQEMPMIPRATLLGPMTPGLGGPMVTNSTAVAPPPPSCSGAVDLSTGCAMPMLGGL